MTVADIVIEELQSRQVRFVASLNGHGLDPFYIACRRAGMRVVDFRNEQAASYAAEVVGRLSRGVGVCAVSGAVAHANALSGVVNAWFDGAPMLLITGTTGHADFGWGSFQDFDPVPMADPVCKYARRIDVPHRAAQIVHEAFTAATSGRPGPVHLSLPLDVAGDEPDPSVTVRSPVRSGCVRIVGAAEKEQVERVGQMLQSASRPLLVAGSGVYYARGEAALARLARRQRIPIVVPIWDRGAVEEPLDEFMGVVGAASGTARLLPDADLIILAGVDFDYRIGQTLPPAVAGEATVVRIHADARSLRGGLEADVSIQASPAVALDQLAEECDRLGCEPAEPWLAEARSRLDAHRAACLASADSLPAGLNGRDVVLAVREVLTERTILLIDGGNIGQWFHQLALDRYPGRWVTCGASGVVGWGLGGALGARAQYPDRPVVLLSGDGAFTFTVAELECAARQGLPFVAVVADDEQWGISVTGQVATCGEALYSELGPTRFDQVAEGFGCIGVRAVDREQLVEALRVGVQADRPTVIQVPIVPGSPVHRHSRD